MARPCDRVLRTTTSYQSKLHWGVMVKAHLGPCIGPSSMHFITEVGSSLVHGFVSTPLHLSYLTSSSFLHPSDITSFALTFNDFISEQDQHHRDLVADQPESWRPAQVALVYGKDYPQHYGLGNITADDQQLACALSPTPSTLEHFDATALKLGLRTGFSGIANNRYLFSMVV